MTGKASFDRIMRERSLRMPRKVQQISGYLGIRTGGENVVDIPSRPGFVWVRLRNVDNEVIAAFNDKVSPIYNLPVLLERDSGSPNRYKIIGVDRDIYGSNWGSASSYVPAHGTQHSFNKDDSNTGGDVSWMYSEQFLPLLVVPSGSAGSGNVLVWPYVYHDDDGNYYYAGNTGTASLLGNKPTGSSNARMSLVYLDTSTGNPTILAGTTEFAATITGTAAVLQYIPSVPDNDDIALAGVRLVSGTSTIGWANLYDIRELLHEHPQEGTGNGGGGDLVIYDDSAFKVTGTAISFDDNLTVEVTGSVAYIDASGAQGPAGDNTLLIYDDSAFKVTGSYVSFDDNLTVHVTGAYAYIDGSAGGGYTEGARVYNSSNTTVNNTTVTTINFDSEYYDTDTIHDTATGTFSRLTCKTEGKYLIEFHGIFDSAIQGQASACWLEHDSRGRLVQQGIPNVNNTNPTITIATICDLAVNDYIVVKIYHNSGASETLLASGGGNEYSSVFSMQRIG